MELINLSLDYKTIPEISKFRKGDQKILFINNIIYYDEDIICYLASLKKEKFVKEIGKILQESNKVKNKYSIIYLELLKYDARSKTYWVFIKQKLPRLAGKLIREFRGNLFLKPPIILSPSRFEIKFLITEDKIEIFKSFLDNNKLKYKWVKVNRIKIEKEKSKEEAFELLRFALEMGYYENPRRVKADDLAKMLGISKSTFIRKLRNYEKRIIADSLSLKDNLD